MAVTNNATLIEDFEGAGPSALTKIGGGKAPSLNTDIFINGNQSAGVRSDNTANVGISMGSAGTFDLSTAGEHMKFCMWVTQYDQVTAASVRIGTSTTVYETHTITVAEWPPLGGWFIAWFEVDAGTDTGSPNFANCDTFGFVISINDVGGNAENQICDQYHHSERPVLTWDGSTGAFSDFVTTSDSVALGVLIDINGALNLYANVQIGSSTATTFTDSGVVILAPNFSHLPTGSTWSGIDIDLQNASTVVTWTGSVYGASDLAQTRKPDLLVTGTSGSADLSSNRFQGLRIVDFTDAVTANDTTFDACGQIDLTAAGTAGADISGSTITGSTVAAGEAAILWDVNADPDGETDNTTHVMGANDHAAYEFGTNTPATITLRGQTVTGFSASNDVNASVLYFRDTGSDRDWTVNVIGGTGTFSYRTERVGDTVDIVADPVDLTVTVQDTDETALEGAKVLAFANTTGDLNADAAITSITESAGTATVTTTAAHGLATNDVVFIRDEDEDNTPVVPSGALTAEAPYTGTKSITVTGGSTFTFTVSGSPTTPATRTYTFSDVILDYVSTNGSGVATVSRTYSADQSVQGGVFLSTGSRQYKPGNITGTIDSATGLPLTVTLLDD